jgi:hypothetical protein
MIEVVYIAIGFIIGVIYAIVIFFLFLPKENNYSNLYQPDQDSIKGNPPFGAGAIDKTSKKSIHIDILA